MKRPWQSKINWIGLVVTLLGVALDPRFKEYTAQWLSPQLIGNLVGLAGLLTMVIRSCCTNQGINLGKESK